MADPTQAEIDAYYKDLYQGKGGHISKADVEKVKQQILSQGLTSKWKGEGFGSADANALDMAKSLVASGVTDIKQLKQGTFYVPQAVTERLVNESGQPVQQNGGKYYVNQMVTYGDGQVDQLIEVDPKTVTKQLGIETVESSGDVSNDVFTPLTAAQQKQLKTDATGQMTVPVEGGQGIINKDTGERILSNYNERTQGNAFGGTYAGKGNTAYRVQFDAKGNPVFFTTEASSNDLANLLSNPILNFAANAAATYFGGPLGTMALQAVQGKDTGDILKSGALSWAGGQAASYLSGSESLVDVLGKTGANIAANAAKSFVTSEGKIDPVAALLAGGMDAGVGAIIGNIPGFEGLDKGTQTAVTKAISNTLRTGKLDPASLAQAAFKAGTSAMANATNTPTEAEFNAANTEFLKTLEPYLSTDPTAGKDHLIKVLTDAGMTPEEAATVDYGPRGDLSMYANQDIKVDPSQWDSYTKNLQGIIDNGGYTSQWQTVGTDRIMIQDDGTAIATNENGDPYSLTKAEVDQMVNNGILNTAESGYVAATGGTGNNPGGTKNQPPPPPAGGTKPPAPTAGSPTAGTSSSPTVSRFGLDPLDVLRMKNDVAHIKSFKELFGHDFSVAEQTPASSAQDQTDVVEAATGGQVYSGGGDIHALLQLLRS